MKFSWHELMNSYWQRPDKGLGQNKMLKIIAWSFRFFFIRYSKVLIKHRFFTPCHLNFYSVLFYCESFMARINSGWFAVVWQGCLTLPQLLTNWFPRQSYIILLKWISRVRVQFQMKTLQAILIFRNESMNSERHNGKFISFTPNFCWCISQLQQLSYQLK